MQSLQVHVHSLEPRGYALSLCSCTHVCTLIVGMVYTKLVPKYVDNWQPVYGG